MPRRHSSGLWLLESAWEAEGVCSTLERSAQTAADSLSSVSDTAPREASRITPDEVRKVATLARLTLTDDELAVATAELGAMLDHFADIDALDLDDVEPMMQPTPLANVMREDVEGVTLDRDEVLGQAPLAEDGRFRVPPIIGIEE
jgi:aspartyl-tRNA(Asn)/glutamyl-tRNA(Gln) amidotransferase subunit C